MTGFFEGVATAMITPFSDSGINFALFERLIDRQIGAGVETLVFLGTTGEPCALLESEKREIAEFAVETCQNRCKVIFGCGNPNTKTAVENATYFESVGADGLLCITPYYSKCTERGAYDYYSSISKSVSIPFLAYNVPSRTGFCLSEKTVQKLCLLPNFAGIKEASGNVLYAEKLMTTLRRKCDLFSGDDFLNLPLFSLGAKGTVSVVSNLLPEKVVELYRLCKSGDYEKANDLNDALLPLVSSCFSEVNPVPVKAGLEILGYAVGQPRSPLTGAELKTRLALKSALGALKEKKL